MILKTTPEENIKKVKGKGQVPLKKNTSSTLLFRVVCLFLKTKPEESQRERPIPIEENNSFNIFISSGSYVFFV